MALVSVFFIKLPVPFLVSNNIYRKIPAFHLQNSWRNLVFPSLLEMLGIAGYFRFRGCL